MKRILCVILAAILFASVLSSCASLCEQSAPDPRITLTSSDAADAAAWLADRLGGALTERVVLGTNAEVYGVELSALEDDGYVIRHIGGEIALFARTADGLDRAVRKYAKAVEAGGEIGDETYHEGYRVKRVEIAGRDIAEYTIFCEDDAYMPKAANELRDRIKEACGASLPVSTNEPCAPYIAVRYAHDEALSTVGYRWSVDENGLVVECSDGYKPTSAHFALTRLLMTELDWFGLDFGNDDLACAELISFDVGETGGEVNDFDYANLYGDVYVRGDVFEHLDYYSMKTCPLQHCCHGLQNNRFAGELSKYGNWMYDQPCWLDDTFLEVSVNDIRAYIEKQIASGAVLGEDFRFVDVAAGDNSAWCKCKKCRKMYGAEGGTEAGAVVTWANAMSEELNEEYPGIMYGIFAYAGSNRPPKTVRPNEHIHITFCYDSSCDAHPLNSLECNGEKPIFNSTEWGANADMTSWLRGWCDISPNVYVWFYYMTNGLLTMSFVHKARDDMRLFYDIGVKGFFLEAEDVPYSTGKVAKLLMAKLFWDIDIDDEAYDAYYDRVLAEMYGDAGPLVREYIDYIDRIQENGHCVSSWFWGFGISPSLNEPLWVEHYDRLFEIVEAAIPLANDARQERRLINYSCACIYKGAIASYFPAYNAGDDERVAELCRRYALIDERLSKYGIDMTVPHTVDTHWSDERNYERDLEVQIWESWTSDPPFVTPWYDVEPEREMPERVAAILAEREAK